MPNFILSPEMNLPIPVVGVDPGPDYAINVDTCFTIVDGHTHAPGSGNQITPAGININVDLPINSNNIVSVRSLKFTPQGSPISLPGDIGCIYESGIDLYYNDGVGNQVRLTQGGSVAGTPGSIANLVPPASASYNSGTGTFIFQSGANIPGNLDGASITIRDQTLGSNGITLAAPALLASSFTITLPSYPLSFPGSPPSVESYLEMDNIGNITTSPVFQRVSNTTTVGIGGIGISSSCGSFGSGNSGAPGDPITNFSIQITTTGRPVFLGMQPDGSTNPAFFAFQFTAPATASSARIYILRDGTQIGVLEANMDTASSTGALTYVTFYTPPGQIFIDTPTAGTYTYSFNLGTNGGLSNGNALLGFMSMYCYEMV